MASEIHSQVGRVSLAETIFKHTGISVCRCYQCGKCSAGCPLAGEMDYPPSVIIRMLQTGLPELSEKVLRSYSIWLCLSCETCATRCPMEIELPEIMDALRALAFEQKKVNPRAREIIHFHKSFLDTVKYTGRLYELGLIAAYKARSRHLLQDVAMAPLLFLKGKLKPLPHQIKDRAGIRKIFASAFQHKEDKA